MLTPRVKTALLREKTVLFRLCINKWFMKTFILLSLPYEIVIEIYQFLYPLITNVPYTRTFFKTISDTIITYDTNHELNVYDYRPDKEVDVIHYISKWNEVIVRKKNNNSVIRSPTLIDVRISLETIGHVTHIDSGYGFLIFSKGDDGLWDLEITHWVNLVVQNFKNILLSP